MPIVASGREIAVNPVLLESNDTVTARTCSRGRLYAFAFALLFLNALPPFVATAVRANGWLLASANLFDISAVVWVAFVAALLLAWRSEAQDRVAGRDKVIAAVIAVVALVPSAPLSSLALTALSAFIVLSERHGSGLRRAGFVFLSLTAFLLWGRMTLAFASGPLLTADAQFVAFTGGLEAVGNMVSFPNGGSFVIAPGCSSLHGISLAVVLWTTAVAWFDLAPDRSMRIALATAVAISVVVNCARLVTIAWNPVQFEYWHVGGGAQIFGWIALLAVGAVIFVAVDRAQRAG